MKRVFGILSLLILTASLASADTGAATVSGNLSLDRAVSIALKQNPDILRALQEIKRTRGQVVEVRAEALPHVALTGSYRQEDKDFLERSDYNSVSFGPGTTSAFDSATGGDKAWRVTMEARQILYSGGQVRAAIKIAKFTEDQSYYMLRDTVERVVSTVRTQFYFALLNRKLITVAEESIRLLTDELSDQRNRFQAGTVTRFNVLRAEVALANAQPELIRSKNGLVIAELELAKTLGLSATKHSTGKPSFSVVGELRATERHIGLQKALTLAKKNRAILKAQKQTILADEQQITIAAAGGKPRLEATGGWEFRNSRVTDDVLKEANGWFAGVNGSWNVWDGNATKGKIAQAKARLASSQINYSDSEQQVELEVQRAFAKLQEAKELLTSQGKVIEQADESLRLSRERLAAGSGTQLDVLAADVALTQAKTTQQRALYEYNAALAEFDRAIGADTIYDNTFVDPRAEQAKSRFRKSGATLRSE